MPGQRNFQPKHLKNNHRSFNGRKKIDAMYDSKWESYRRRFLDVNPECYACGHPATVVDHIQAHKGDINLFWKVDNYIPLCVVDHNTVTTKFERKQTGLATVVKKIKWLNDKRLSLGLSKKVKVLPFEGDILCHIKDLKSK